MNEEVYDRLRIVGAAISRINGNNTHSGNLSMRDPYDRDTFYITSSGSQCGALIPQDIVPIKFSGVSWGDARGSTESTIHRKILSLPGVNSAVHAHYLSSTYLSFDTKEKQLFLKYTGTDAKGREEFVFTPLDFSGVSALGEVRVGSYYQPVGSAEMEERIPRYLEKEALTVVRGHGSFVRASSPEQALHLLSVFESSAVLALHLRRKGVPIVDLGEKMNAKGMERLFPKPSIIFEEIHCEDRDIDDETMIADFAQRLHYNYNNQLSAYATGSMSQKISADEMVFCPTSAVPEGLTFPLRKVSLQSVEDEECAVALHKLIYRYTHQNTCMITTSPMITAEGMAVLAESYGERVLLGEAGSISYEAKRHPVILPIDAEAIYLNPKLGLVDISALADRSPENPIFNMLRWYKGCCVVAGYGVISTGDTTLEQAAHNASSAERIAQFRAAVFINEKMANGPSVAAFEPKSH